MPIRKFNRYELKYFLRHQDYTRFVKDLEFNIKRDEHANEEGIYRISSLYYDSMDLSCYRNKLDGIKYRRKLRLRVYRDSDMSLGFVEIKQRINRTVQKRRLTLPIDDAKALCTGDDSQLERLDAAEREVASEVIFLVKALSMRPQCIISYNRRAFEGSRYDHGLRITFDTHLTCRMHELDVTKVCKERYFLPPDAVVMEIKANDKIPMWLISTLGRHECSLKRISKYCVGLEAGFSMLRKNRLNILSVGRPGA